MIKRYVLPSFTFKDQNVNISWTGVLLPKVLLLSLVIKRHVMFLYCVICIQTKYKTTLISLSVIIWQYFPISFGQKQSNSRNVNVSIRNMFFCTRRKTNDDVVADHGEKIFINFCVVLGVKVKRLPTSIMRKFSFAYSINCISCKCKIKIFVTCRVIKNIKQTRYQVCR